MKINPTGRQVAIEPIEQASKTAGGIDIPDTAIKLLDEGTILELGPQVDQSLFHEPIKAGDRVAYSRYAGNWLKFARNGDTLSNGPAGDTKDDKHRNPNIKLVDDRDILSVPTQ